MSRLSTAEPLPSSAAATIPSMVTASRRQDETGRAILLDVLRGIAVLAVIALHSGSHGVGHSTDWYDTYVWPWLSHGYLGVQLFFVISGYCIQGAVESARRNPRPLQIFALRRIRRIYPPYWWSLIVTIALACGTIALLGKPWWSIFPLTTAEWLLNILLMQGPFGVPDAALVYWSLTIEVQFYVVMAIGLLFGRWSAAWLLGLSIAYLAWIVRPAIGISGTVLAYWPEFACGIGAYYAIHHGKYGKGVALGLWLLTTLSALAGLSHGVPVISADGEFSTPFKQFFCLFCGGLLWVVHNRSAGIHRWAVFRRLAQIGVISYSLYLTHVPVGSRIFNFAGRIVDLQGPLWIPVMILSLVVQFAAGYVFYRYCEAPWLNVHNHITPVQPVKRTF